LKDDIENMQVRAVETARSNSNSESSFDDTGSSYEELPPTIVDIKNKQHLHLE